MKCLGILCGFGFFAQSSSQQPRPCSVWAQSLLKDQRRWGRRRHPNHQVSAPPTGCSSGLRLACGRCTLVAEQASARRAALAAHYARRAGRQLSKHCPVRVATAASHGKSVQTAHFSFVPKHSHGGGKKTKGLEKVLNTSPIDPAGESRHFGGWRVGHDDVSGAGALVPPWPCTVCENVHHTSGLLSCSKWRRGPTHLQR